MGNRGHDAKGFSIRWHTQNGPSRRAARKLSTSVCGQFYDANHIRVAFSLPNTDLRKSSYVNLVRRENGAGDNESPSTVNLFNNLNYAMEHLRNNCTSLLSSFIFGLRAAARRTSYSTD